MRRNSLVFALSLLLSAIPAARAADIVIGNMPSDSQNFSGFSGPTVKAVSFTMGATSYTLDSVILQLQGYEALDTPVIQIRNDTGGSDPGSTVLVSFSNPASQGSSSFAYTFTPTSSFTLQGTTKYWLYVTGADFNWSASVPSVTPTGLATYGGYLYSSDSGSSFISSSTYNSFQINGTVVPEPSTVILAALSVATFAATALKSRRRS